MNNNIQSSILLTRSYEENVILSKKLNNLLYRCVHFPLIFYEDFDFDYENILYEYDHLIVTSNYVAKKIPKISNYSNKKKFVWCVGALSANILSSKGYDVKYFAKNVDILKKNIPTSLFNNMIYLSGNNISSPMPDKIKRIIIYNVRYRTSINRRDYIKLTYPHRYILLYSVNCAKTFINLALQYDYISYLKNSIIVAISDKVMQIVADYFNKFLVSRTPETVIQTLIDYERKNKGE